MKRNILLLSIVLVGFSVLEVCAQSTFTCKVDGDSYSGKVADAVQVNIAKEDYLQVRTQQENRGMHLYIKLTKLNSALPLTIKYVPQGPENQAAPDAEVIWVPDPEQPQWNTIEGELVVTSFDPAGKTIEGNFNFVVEKAEYGSKKKKTLEIEDGKFSIAQYKIEEPAKK
jgi:hypothetical protein